MNRKLFKTGLAKPMQFHLDSADRQFVKYAKLILNHGGELCAVLTAGVCSFTSAFDQSGFRGTYKIEYIDDCIRANRILNLNKYLWIPEKDSSNSQSTSSNKRMDSNCFDAKSSTHLSAQVHFSKSYVDGMESSVDLGMIYSSHSDEENAMVKEMERLEELDKLENAKVYMKRKENASACSDESVVIVIPDSDDEGGSSVECERKSKKMKLDTSAESVSVQCKKSNKSFTLFKENNVLDTSASSASCCLRGEDTSLLPVVSKSKIIDKWFDESAMLANFSGLKGYKTLDVCVNRKSHFSERQVEKQQQEQPLLNSGDCDLSDVLLSQDWCDEWVIDLKSNVNVDVKVPDELRAGDLEVELSKRVDLVDTLERGVLGDSNGSKGEMMGQSVGLMEGEVVEEKVCVNSNGNSSKSVVLNKSDRLFPRILICGSREWQEIEQERCRLKHERLSVAMEKRKLEQEKVCLEEMRRKFMIEVEENIAEIEMGKRSLEEEGQKLEDQIRIFEAFKDAEERKNLAVKIELESWELMDGNTGLRNGVSADKQNSKSSATALTDIVPQKSDKIGGLNIESCSKVEMISVGEVVVSSSSASPSLVLPPADHEKNCFEDNGIFDHLFLSSEDKVTDSE